MVDFVIHVHRVHLDILEVKTSLGVLNYPTAATMKRYQGQIRHVGRDKRTNISSYNSMNTKQDGGPPRPRTRAQSLYKAYYDKSIHNHAHCMNIISTPERKHRIF